MALDTPIIFILFRRPETTRRVFEEIRRAKPRRLFLVADGPRGPQDDASCQLAREVVADIDWLFDPFSLQKTTLGDEIAVRPLNDNISFLLNMIEYATGADALLEIRSRGQLQRPFTRVADLFRNAQQKLQEQEATLSSNVTALEQQLGQINQQTQDLEFADLPESIKLKLQEFQDELLSARRDLREVRHEIRSEVEALGRRLTLINLAAGPAQILFLALIVMMWRIYRSRAHARP